MSKSILISPGTATRLLDRKRHDSALGRLVGASTAIATVEFANTLQTPLLVIATDPRQANQLVEEIRWFSDGTLPVMDFVEWETLPYDSFSPHQDIISERLKVLGALPDY